MIDTKQGPKGLRHPPRRNVRKLLARLNPKGMKFQPGQGGGISNETALDIAAAAGMAGQAGAPQKLAILALCLRWWPAMFEGPMRTVGHRIITHHRKARRADDTEKVIKHTERIAIEAPSETPAFESVASLIASCIERRITKDLDLYELNLNDQLRAQLHGEHAPALRRLYGRPLTEAVAERVLGHGSFLPRWARAVIEEYRNPNHCQSCQSWGRAGMVPKAVIEANKVISVEWERCEPCLGQGVVAWSTHRRAAALSIGIHPYRDFLRGHHDGALALLRTLEDRGAGLLLNRLGED